MPAATRLARRWSADSRFAFGTWKIEVLAGYTSALFLLGVAAMMVIIPLNNRPCVSMVTGRTTIDTAGAVVATDWTSTSAPESCRRPNARSGDRAGGCFSRVVK